MQSFYDSLKDNGELISNTTSWKYSTPFDLKGISKYWSDDCIIRTF